MWGRFGTRGFQAVPWVPPPDADWPVQHCWACGKFGTRVHKSRTYRCEPCDVEWTVPLPDSGKTDGWGRTIADQACQAIDDSRPGD